MVSRTVDSSPGGVPSGKTRTSGEAWHDGGRIDETTGRAELNGKHRAIRRPGNYFVHFSPLADGDGYSILGASSSNSTLTFARVGTVSMSTQPSLIEWRKLRFVIMDAPKANNLHLYLRELKKHNVVCVVRVCEPTYQASEVEAAGMQLLEMEYDDGAAPPPEIIHRWLKAVRLTFQDAPDSSGPNGSEGPAIAVHCVAGLGRAPVLVAIALIEYGEDPIKAVEYIRSQRRGAINRHQLTYLDNYERRSRGQGCSSCVIM